MGFLFPRFCSYTCFFRIQRLVVYTYIGSVHLLFVNGVTVGRNTVHTHIHNCIL